MVILELIVNNVKLNFILNSVKLSLKIIILDVGSCSTNPCVNGGTCNNMLSGGYTCTCPSNYSINCFKLIQFKI
jgi:hypothetical protein